MAVALPVFSDSLDVIPVVGAWVNSVLDGVATALQGMAVAYVLMQAKAVHGRLRGLLRARTAQSAHICAYLSIVVYRGASKVRAASRPGTFVNKRICAKFPTRFPQQIGDHAAPSAA